MADDRVVVTDGGGSGMGVVVGILVGVLLLLGVLYFTGAFGKMLGNGDKDINIKVETPKSPGAALPLA